MTIEEARNLLHEMTEGESLLRHARTVELVMRSMARHFGEDEEKFAITGLLHDADYEKYPSKHPSIIVARLKEEGEDEIAHGRHDTMPQRRKPRREPLTPRCIGEA